MGTFLGLLVFFFGFYHENKTNVPHRRVLDYQKHRRVLSTFFIVLRTALQQTSYNYVQWPRFCQLSGGFPGLMGRLVNTVKELWCKTREPQKWLQAPRHSVGVTGRLASKPSGCCGHSTAWPGHTARYALLFGF